MSEFDRLKAQKAAIEGRERTKELDEGMARLAAMVNETVAERVRLRGLLREAWVTVEATQMVYPNDKRADLLRRIDEELKWKGKP